MSKEAPPAAADLGVNPDILRRKLFWRIVPLIFVLYIISYLDRVNVSFAKLRMQQDLKFTDHEFGVAFGIFFFGYLLLEIPGALLVEHWSARKWFARILVTWGLCSMGLALVRTPLQFYVARFLLGLAEAGFFPGVVVYFTHWFPRADRGRAFAGMVLAIPVSQAFGALVSGLLLQASWFGLAGWQWLFLVEGFPAVLMGVAVLFVMTDRPGQARWLRPAEKAWLERTLAAERRATATLGGVTFRRALRLPAVWLLALAIMATNTGGYGLVFWLPTVVKQFLTGGRAQPGTAEGPADEGPAEPSEGDSAKNHTVPADRNSKQKKADESKDLDVEVLQWSALVYSFGLAGVWLAGQSSDRTGERKWHCVAAQVMTGVCLAGSSLPGQPWPAVLAWLCLVAFFAIAWPPPFWVLPTLTLSASAAAVSIGFINICANVAGLLGPPLVGELRSRNFSNSACLVVLAGFYVLGGAIVSVLRVPRTKTG
jgi:ACS family tartrate transporter-like MFS transporter